MPNPKHYINKRDNAQQFNHQRRLSQRHANKLHRKWLKESDLAPIRAPLDLPESAELPSFLPPLRADFVARVANSFPNKLTPGQKKLYGFFTLMMFLQSVHGEQPRRVLHLDNAKSRNDIPPSPHGDKRIATTTEGVKTGNPNNRDNFALLENPHNETVINDFEHAVVSSRGFKNPTFRFDRFYQINFHHDVIDLHGHFVPNLKAMTIKTMGNDSLLTLPSGYRVVIRNFPVYHFYTNPTQVSYFHQEDNWYRGEYPTLLDESLTMMGDNKHAERFSLPSLRSNTVVIDGFNPTIEHEFDDDFFQKSHFYYHDAIDISSQNITTLSQILARQEGPDVRFSFPNNYSVKLKNISLSSFFNHRSEVSFFQDGQHAFQHDVLTSDVDVTLGIENHREEFHLPFSPSNTTVIRHFDTGLSSNIQDVISLTPHNVTKLSEIKMDSVGNDTHLVLPNGYKVIIQNIPSSYLYSRHLTFKLFRSKDERFPGQYPTYTGDNYELFGNPRTRDDFSFDFNAKNTSIISQFQEIRQYYDCDRRTTTYIHDTIDVAQHQVDDLRQITLHEMGNDTHLTLPNGYKVILRDFPYYSFYTVPEQGRVFHNKDYWFDGQHLTYVGNNFEMQGRPGMQDEFYLAFNSKNQAVIRQFGYNEQWTCRMYFSAPTYDAINLTPHNITSLNQVELYGVDSDTHLKLPNGYIVVIKDVSYQSFYNIPTGVNLFFNNEDHFEGQWPTYVGDTFEITGQFKKKETFSVCRWNASTTIIQGFDAEGGETYRYHPSFAEPDTLDLTGCDITKLNEITASQLGNDTLLSFPNAYRVILLKFSVLDLVKKSDHVSYFMKDGKDFFRSQELSFRNVSNTHKGVFEKRDDFTVVNSQQISTFIDQFDTVYMKTVGTGNYISIPHRHDVINLKSSNTSNLGEVQIYPELNDTLLVLPNKHMIRIHQLDFRELITYQSAVRFFHIENNWFDGQVLNYTGESISYSTRFIPSRFVIFPAPTKSTTIQAGYTYKRERTEKFHGHFKNLVDQIDMSLYSSLLSSHAIQAEFYYNSSILTMPDGHVVTVEGVNLWDGKTSERTIDLYRRHGKQDFTIENVNVSSIRYSGRPHEHEVFMAIPHRKIKIDHFDVIKDSKTLTLHDQIDFGSISSNNNYIYVNDFNVTGTALTFGDSTLYLFNTLPGYFCQMLDTASPYLVPRNQNYTFDCSSTPTLSLLANAGLQQQMPMNVSDMRQLPSWLSFDKQSRVLFRSGVVTDSGCHRIEVTYTDTNQTSSLNICVNDLILLRVLLLYLAKFLPTFLISVFTHLIAQYPMLETMDEKIREKLRENNLAVYSEECPRFELIKSIIEMYYKIRLEALSIPERMINQSETIMLSLLRMNVDYKREWLIQTLIDKMKHYSTQTLNQFTRVEKMNFIITMAFELCAMFDFGMNKYSVIKSFLHLSGIDSHLLMRTNGDSMALMDEYKQLASLDSYTNHPQLQGVYVAFKLHQKVDEVRFSSFFLLLSFPGMALFNSYALGILRDQVGVQLNNSDEENTLFYYHSTADLTQGMILYFLQQYYLVKHVPELFIVSPVERAAFLNNVPMIKDLVGKFHTLDSNALNVAIQFSSLSAVTDILRIGVDINSPDRNGITPLQKAFYTLLNQRPLSPASGLIIDLLLRKKINWFDQNDGPISLFKLVKILQTYLASCRVRDDVVSLNSEHLLSVNHHVMFAEANRLWKAAKRDKYEIRKNAWVINQNSDNPFGLFQRLPFEMRIRIAAETVENSMLDDTSKQTIAHRASLRYQRFPQ